MLRTEELRKRITFVEEYLMTEYKLTHPQKKRDWRTYEQQLTYRVKEAIRSIEPLVDEAVSTIKMERGQGRYPELSLKQKVLLLLIKELFDKSNRNMACMIDLFSLLSGIDVSYKTVERLYSDPEVDMALHNLHVLILKKKGVKDVDASGDGTGYSLSITKHYATEAQKQKDRIKEGQKDKKGRRAFVHSFKILDLKTWLYVAYGISFKSEKEAYSKAIMMMQRIDASLASIRLDKYYSSPSCIDSLKDTKVYIIPKKNASVRGSLKWKKTMEEYVNNTIAYLEQYYKRENSESGFSQDKRWFGWKVEQRREDRIEMAITCSNVWHNLFNMPRV